MASRVATGWLVAFGQSSMRGILRRVRTDAALSVRGRSVGILFIFNPRRWMTRTAEGDFSFSYCPHGTAMLVSRLYARLRKPMQLKGIQKFRENRTIVV